MPLYIVKEPGFWGGKLYDPNGRRNVLETAKPIPTKKLPSWLEPAPKAANAKAEKAKIDNPPTFIDESADSDDDAGVETL